eukprot:402683_1
MSLNGRLDLAAQAYHKALPILRVLHGKDTDDIKNMEEFVKQYGSIAIGGKKKGAVARQTRAETERNTAAGADAAREALLAEIANEPASPTPPQPLALPPTRQPT